MVSHHPDNFGDQRHCGSGDMFVVVEGQNSAFARHYCFSLKHKTCHGDTYEISERRHINLPVCLMKDARSWSYISTRTTDIKKAFASLSKNSAMNKEKKKNE